MTAPRTCLIHDFLLNYGGAEKCAEAIAEIFPRAPIHTIAWNPKNVPFASNRIIPTIADGFPCVRKRYHIYIPLYPFIAYTIHPKGDIIISSFFAFCKGFKKRKGQLHICYCHCPPRFLYDFPDSLYARQPWLLRVLLRPIILALRWWDIRSAKNVDYFITTSKSVQARIKQWYKRDAIVIHPFVDTQKFSLRNRKRSYYLFVGRLALPYKKADVAVQAFNKLGLPLVVVGDGRDRKFLESMAKPNIRFIGAIHDEKKLADYYQGAKAVIFPSYDDFGMVPIEAQACGTPVIAYVKGGALETVIEGKTGHFFTPQTSDALAKAVKEFEKMRFTPKDIRKNALRFDKKVFQKKIKRFIDQKWSEKHLNAPTHL